MAEFKLGRIKFVYQGTWQTGHTYVPDDVVTVGGKSYICVVGHSSSPNFVTDLTAGTPKWNLMADGTQWRGDWHTSTLYNAGDLVRYNGIVYICSLSHTSASTASVGLEIDHLKWDQFTTSMYWRGDWAADTRYKLNDVVNYGADLWICTAWHTSAGTTIDESNFTVLVKGLEFVNTWNDSSNYAIGDIVSYGGFVYVSNTDNINAVPSTSASDWSLFTAGFSFQGDWNNSLNYKVGDVVRLGGYTYLATADSFGNEPPDVSYWTQLNQGLRWTNTSQVYTNVSGTNLTGTGSNATFDVTRSNTVYTVVKNAAGSGYSAGNTIKILGTSVGGISPANDITVTVSNVNSGQISGVTWTGISSTWTTSTSYKLGDLVFFGANSYICVQSHSSGIGQRPDNDTAGDYWNLFVFGTEQAVMTTTGDMFYYGANGVQRLPIGSDGQVLKVVGTTPTWSNFGVINNVVYVSNTTGVDTLATSQGLTLDKPWKTIQYAAQQVERGYLNPQASMLLAKNKQFIIKEVNNYIQYTYKVSITGTSSNAFTTSNTSGLYTNMPIVFTSTTGGVVVGTTYYVKSITANTSFTISASQSNGVAGTQFNVTGVGTNTGKYAFTTKTERDAGILLDAVVFDISHGGTSKTTAAALAFFDTTGASWVSGVYANDITAILSAQTYMSTLTGNILANTVPTQNYQTLNSVATPAQQIIDSSLTAESGIATSVAGLISIVKTGITGGTTSFIPTAIYPNTTISVKTGTYNEYLPVVVPANTALVGDELRSTVVQPASAVPNLINDSPKSVASLNRIKAILPNLLSNTLITPSTGNTTVQEISLPAGNVGSTAAATTVTTNVALIRNILNNGLTQVPAATFTNPTNYNSSLTDTAYASTGYSGSTLNFGDGKAQILQNYQFIQDEISAYMNATYPTEWSSMGAANQIATLRDVRYILDAIVYDMTYGGNTQTLIAGSAYYSLSINQILSTYTTAVTGTLTWLKSFIDNIVVANTAGWVKTTSSSQVTSGTAGSPGAGTFAQDRVQDVLDWIANGYANATVSPYTSWASSSLQTAYSALSTARAEIASDAKAWVYKNYHGQTISQSLSERDAGLVVDALAYDLLLGSNFASITAGRAYRRANTSALALIATELAATDGAISFIGDKARYIAASGSTAQTSQLIEDAIANINGYASSTAVFNGTISGTLLTINSVTSGTIATGMTLTGTGIAPGTQITGGSGSSWTINYSQSVSSLNVSVSAVETGTNKLTVSSTNGIVAGLQITVTGVALSNLTAGTYYVASVVDSTHITISSTFGGSTYSITSSVSGAMSATVYGVYNGLSTTTAIVGKVASIPVTAVATSTNQITVADTSSISVNMPVVFSGLPADITTTATATTVTTNVITLSATVGSLGIAVNQPIWFTGSVFGNIVQNQLYYVKTAASSSITVSLTIGGSAVVLATGSGSMSVNVNNAGGLVNGNTYWVNSVVDGTHITVTNSYKSGTAFTIGDSVAGMTATAVIGKPIEVHGSSAYNNVLGTINGAEILRANKDFLADEASAYIASTYTTTVTSTTASSDRFNTSSAHPFVVGDPVVFSGVISNSGVSASVEYYVLSVPTTTSFTLTATQGGTLPIDVSADGTGSVTVTYYYNSTQCKRDTREFVDAWIYDLNYQGNYKTSRVTTLYLAAVNGSASSNMWLLRNATGIRNMTLTGLTGALTSLNAYNTKRPVAGAYSSLDPGFGPNDSSVWINSRSPYTQNCTMFGAGCTGVKIDASLHYGGNKSIVANDYTTILSDGIGAWCTGSGALTELISVFCYYSYSGYLSELGGRIRAANGNSSYGTYGVVAEGVDAFETPIYGTINNRYNQAQITNTVTDGTTQILRFEYGNAGSGYSNTVHTISGAGYNAFANADEYRDASTFETRIVDKNDGTGVGGTNYVTISNASQGGATGYVTLAATDLSLTDAYKGMRIQLTAGTGVGQYANILSNNNGTKNALVIKDSFTPLYITASASTNSLFTVASTATLYTGMPIYLNTGIGGATANTLYYVIAANFSATQFAVSTSSGGLAISLSTVATQTVTVTATSTANNIITATNTLTAGDVVTFNSSFNGITASVPYYVLATNLTSAGFSVSLEPNGTVVTITTTGAASSTGTISHAVYAAGWDHAIPGKAVVNALDLTTGYIVEPKISYTGPGFTGTARALNNSATWTAATYGSDNFVAVSSGGTTTNYSTDGKTWLTGGAQPSSQTWGDVTYMGGQGATLTAVVGGLGGSGAVFTATVGTGSSAGQITGVTVVNGGVNYTTPPTIVFSGGGGSGASATCTVLNGTVQAVTMVINGGGYTSAPTVTANTSIVSNINVTNWGKNYYNTPLITVAYPQGLTPSAWVATTSVSQNAYLLTSDGNIYKVTSAGGTTGSSKPTHTTGSATNGSATLLYVATQAQATANLTNYGVSSVTISNAGYGYTSTPTVTIADPNAKFIAISTASTNTSYQVPSSLGSTWTAGGALPTTTYKAVEYGAGYAIAVGGASGTGTIASSTDAATWTSRTSPALSAGYWADVAFAAGASAGVSSASFTWIAVNNGGIATAISTNAVSWSAGTNLPASFTSAVSVTYGNGKFVVLGSDGKIAYSNDFGVTWIAAPTCAGTSTSVLSSSLTWKKVSYGQGLFVAIASGTQVCATSQDGVNWTVYSTGMPTSSTWTSLAFGNPSANSLGRTPIWVATANSSTTAASLRTGAKSLGRVKVTSGVVSEVRMIEPGSGYPKGVVTATTTSTNVITTNDTINLADGQQIEFTGLDSYGLSSNTTYYVIGSTIVSNTSFKVSAIPASSVAVTLTTGTALSGTYRVTSTATITDGNRVIGVNTRQRNGDGALGNPSFNNRGSGNTTATSSTLGDGYSDLYQPSNFINVANLFTIPKPGANVEFASIPNTWFKLVAVTNVLGIDGNYTAQFQINPAITTLQAPAHGNVITTRLKYSQVRLTGHDFLYIGTGNASNTNYPFVNPANAIIANQEVQSGGGRVFFTSTDQDGNFNVGNLFGVQQSTGTATLNASAFNLAGLQSLQLGAVTLGVGSAVITQFSTDPYFTANSDSIIPTQKAIRSYITSQIGGGQSTLNVNTITSGVIYISNNSITTTTGVQIIVNSKMNFTGGIDGAPVAQAFFMQR